nr:ATP synthase F0 subunit 8 [Euwallacea fornicatus]
MPQMAPISWITLYIFFNLLFILSCIINFYNFEYTAKTPLINKKSISMNWKW